MVSNRPFPGTKALPVMWRRALETLDVESVECAEEEDVVILELPKQEQVATLTAWAEELLSLYVARVRDVVPDALIYAWLDEQSGTFRVSFSRSHVPLSALFSARIEAASSVQELFASCTDLPPFPLDDLDEVDWEAPDSATPRRLKVFAAEPVNGGNEIA